jgi:hypothetical protein
MFFSSPAAFTILDGYQIAAGALALVRPVDNAR